MKLTIEEITYFRDKTQHYTICDVEGDIHLIYGSFYRRVIGGPLYGSTLYFIKDNSKWDFARKRISWSRNDEKKEERDKWMYMNNQFKSFSIDVQELYLDGIKKDLNSVERMK